MRYTVPATLGGESPRPFIPFAFDYWCPVHDRTEEASGAALVDTGSSRSFLPLSAMPAGHAGWDDLSPDGGTAMLVTGNAEYRYWDARITVLGIEVAARWQVYPNDRPSFPVLGLLDIGTAFRLGFDFGADPPAFSIEPYGPNPDSIPLAQLDMVRYADTRYRLADDASAFRLEPSETVAERVSFPMPRVAQPILKVDAPEPLPRIAAPRPSRAVRRALARR